MDLKTALNIVVRPGLKFLPEKMRTSAAEVMLLSIAQQESRLRHRRQIRGPAHGFYQFENGGGIKGVLNHRSTKEHVDKVLSILEIQPGEAYDAVIYNDILATVFARLLLWADARPLPKLNAGHDETWASYISAWRPGKPHRETWDEFHAKALECCKSNAVVDEETAKSGDVVNITNVEMVNESGDSIMLHGNWMIK